MITDVDKTGARADRVGAGENTVKAIASRVGVPPEVLLACNPKLNGRLTMGMPFVIPGQGTFSA